MPLPFPPALNNLKYIIVFLYWGQCSGPQTRAEWFLYGQQQQQELEYPQKSHLYSTEKMNEWGSSYVRGVGALGCSGGCRCRTTTKRSQEWEENLKYVSHNFRKYLQPSKHLFPSVGAVQSLSRVWLFATPWTSACQASLSFTVSQSMLKFMFIESVMPSDYLILCCPLLFLFSIFPCIKVFSNESALHSKWPKYWSFSISPSNEYSGLISF